jgi:hypothetical protein
VNLAIDPNWEEEYTLKLDSKEEIIALIKQERQNQKTTDIAPVIWDR